MRLVLDSSVSLSWCLPGQADRVSLQLLDQVRDLGAYVPAIWHTEMSNIFGLKARSGFLSDAFMELAFELVGSLLIETEFPTELQQFPSLVSTMSRIRLTAYDALYVDLALRTGSRLATFDKEMMTVARQLGVPLAVGL